VVDRLLASPHYGERWGRHWLDLARFAESDGFEHDGVRPHAWRYRDYVVRAFNDDVPYDRFIRQQIAGDELWPDDPEALIATGFNLLGPDMVDSSDQLQRRHNTLNDMTDTTALAFLGLTIGCARCHDHKFEPITQRDYYRFQAFFGSASFERERPIPTAEERARFEAAEAAVRDHPVVRELEALEAPVRERLRQQKIDRLAPEAQAAHRTPAATRDAAQANLVLETADKVRVTDKEVAAAFEGEAKARREELRRGVKQVPRPEPLPRAMTLHRGGGKPARTFVLHRGDITQPGEEVPPGFPEVLGFAGQPPAPEAGRAVLADWIASPKNPLTARVMVNRLWQHHFGGGLVPTPSDFGTHGQPPSHPELLDWLASEFIARGWRLKPMHKLILLSATFRQSSAGHPAREARDPGNTLYWRMNRLRLEGEVIRDSLLAISGRLDPAMGGPGVFPAIPKEAMTGATGWPATEDPAHAGRRSLYIFARRNLRFPFLEVFDAPDSNLSCPSRERSITAPQALSLLNASEVTAAAASTANAVRSAAATANEQVVLAFRRILGRPPSPQERALSEEFLARSPLEEFCRALFNVNDFVFLE
jgi:hypothetical protein